MTHVVSNHEHVTYALQFFAIVFLHQDYISLKEYCLYTEQVCILNILRGGNYNANMTNM